MALCDSFLYLFFNFTIRTGNGTRVCMGPTEKFKKIYVTDPIVHAKKCSNGRDDRVLSQIKTDKIRTRNN